MDRSDVIGVSRVSSSSPPARPRGERVQEKVEALQKGVKFNKAEVQKIGVYERSETRSDGSKKN